MTTIDPLLARQLKRLGLEDVSEPPDREQWQRVLSRISEHYQHVTDDRNLIARSLELSTNEMAELHTKLAAESERLRVMVSAIADALGVFHEIAQSRSLDAPDSAVSSESIARRSRVDMTGSVTSAKRRFAARVASIFGATGGMESDNSAVINDIRTNFLHLADQLVSLLHETAERASMKKQLEVARAVQQMLVPPSDLIERGFVRVAGYFQPAAECGGDWWTVHDLPDGKVLTVIGDVTGHGISSAIITGAAKAACDLARTFTNGKITAAALLEMMNCSIFEAGKQKLMMTCTASIFDPQTRTLTIANAGHNFPYLYRQNSVRQIVTHGAPLGAGATTEYQASTVRLESGDAILWFTDGVTECENAEHEQFSEKRLRAVFQNAAPGGPLNVRRAIVEAVDTFRGERALDDDITIVVAAVE
jgi:serine phosphatase RsbU (regulator of sigma subunit)